MRPVGCESWSHAPHDPTPPLPGRRFCAVHIAEEATALRVEKELAAFQVVLDEFGAEESRHPDEAKDFIEAALRGFLDADLAQLGLRCGSGYRAVAGREKPEQLDVALTLTASSANNWSAHVTARRHLEREPLAVHIEVAYRAERSGDVYEKVKADLDALDRSVQQGVQFGRGLPWTASVLLGPAWPSRVHNVMTMVHQRYHERAPTTVTLGGSEWWPYVDAIVLPGVMFKKHDLFETQALTGTTLPAYLGMPTDDRVPLRPLAIARGFLMHRLRILRGEEAAIASQAWPTAMSSALLGVPTENIDHLRAYFACDADPGIDELWHAGSAPHDDSPRRIAMAVQANPTCTRARPVFALPVLRRG